MEGVGSLLPFWPFMCCLGLMSTYWSLPRRLSHQVGPVADASQQGDASSTGRNTGAVWSEWGKLCTSKVYQLKLNFVSTSSNDRHTQAKPKTKNKSHVPTPAWPGSILVSDSVRNAIKSSPTKLQVPEQFPLHCCSKVSSKIPLEHGKCWIYAFIISNRIYAHPAQKGVKLLLHPTICPFVTNTLHDYIMSCKPLLWGCYIRFFRKWSWVWKHKASKWNSRSPNPLLMFITGTVGPSHSMG